MPGKAKAPMMAPAWAWLIDKSWMIKVITGGIAWYTNEYAIIPQEATTMMLLRERKESGF